MNISNQLQDYFDLLADSIDIIAGVFDDLKIRFAGVNINFSFLVGLSIVIGLINVLKGCSDDENGIDISPLDGYDGDYY